MESKRIGFGGIPVGEKGPVVRGGIGGVRTGIQSNGKQIEAKRDGIGGIPVGVQVETTQSTGCEDRTGAGVTNRGQRAPASSNVYIGISNNVQSGSNQNWSQGNDRWTSSSDRVVSGTHTFKSNDDILRFLKDHPHYLKMPPDQLSSIVATVIGGLALVGSVVLTVVTYGAATSTVVSSILFTLGAAQGALTAGIQGIVTGRPVNFAELIPDLISNSALCVFTMGATAVVMKACSTLSAVALKCVGCLVGASVHSGTHLLVRFANGKPIEAIEVVFMAVEGVLLGLNAACAAIESRTLNGIETEDLELVMSPAKIDGLEKEWQAFVPMRDRAQSCPNLGESPQTLLEPMEKLPVQNAAQYHGVAPSPERYDLAGKITTGGVSGPGAKLTAFEKFALAGFPETNTARDLRAAGPLKEGMRQARALLTDGQLRRFQNHDGMIPSKLIAGLDLFEYDVANAGGRRGALRIVFAVSPGSRKMAGCWFSCDHYRNFRPVQLPKGW